MSKDAWKKKQKAHEEDYFGKKEREVLDKLRNKIEQQPQPSDEEKPGPGPESKKSGGSAGWSDDLI